jgi:CxxC motif-containing protein (DUF1111 family)
MTTQRILATAGLCLAIAALSACAPDMGGGEETPQAGATTAFGVNQVGNSAVFFVDNAQWADIHYRVNGGQQLNVRMGVNGTHNEFTVGSLSTGTVIDYNFTFFDLACPCAKDSPAAKYTHGGSNPPPPPPPPPADAGVPNPPPPTGTNAYPVPSIPNGPTTGGSNPSGTVVPLFSGGTALEPATVVDTSQALITRVGDRVRDRHARESVFHIYEHFLALYFKDRTYTLEIVDKVAKGGTTVDLNLTTLYPQDAPNARAFFRGINTPAEYWHNADFTQVDPLHYTTTVGFNAKEGRNIKVGDRMEIEVGIFLHQPVEGRFNYYSSVWLYVVGSGGIVPFEGQGALLDSFPMPQAGWSGGRTTLNAPYSNEPSFRFMQMATNIAPVSAQPWVEGRRIFHTDMIDGSHSEGGNPTLPEMANRIAGGYVERSCQGCHVNNGRALPAAVGATLTRTSMKVGENVGGTVGPHTKLGTTLQPFRVGGTPEGSAQVSSWSNSSGSFADGQGYQLRKPVYAGTGTIPSLYSARITPPLVGLGLLEAVPESAIAAFIDVNDANGDGVSGRMQVVNDKATGQPRMGRFGWKAATSSLREQVATALNRDMGVRTSLLGTLDCGSAQSGCVAGAAAIADAALALIVRYVALLGVPARRNLSGGAELAGEQLFASAGCIGCHKATLTTSAFAPMTELRNQTIHPYTDLLLHDMGPGLADGLGEGIASGSEWRTPALWGIGLTAGVSGGEAYLHDGRARSVSEAILWHDGEGAKSKAAFVAMSSTQRSQLLAFLASL